MTTRHAACNCGQLYLTCEGDPVRVSMCHCLDCQRRTGGVFSTQAWFPRSQITAIEGRATSYVRVADSGNALIFRFCPDCGATVHYESEGRPGLIAVAVGAFADPSFPAPKHSVWERRRHPWLEALDDPGVEHSS
jgi:hypothetical protein